MGTALVHLSTILGDTCIRNFGTVWKAKQITTENLVAVKIFHVIENDSRQLESLKKEISFLKASTL